MKTEEEPRAQQRAVEPLMNEINEKAVDIYVCDKVARFST
jgi:hypothetical protein